MTVFSVTSIQDCQVEFCKIFPEHDRDHFQMAAFPSDENSPWERNRHGAA